MPILTLIGGLSLVIPRTSLDTFTLRHKFCHGLIGVDQYHGKFVAAISCRQIRRTALLLHYLR
jgi:hypothetical protein